METFFVLLFEYKYLILLPLAMFQGSLTSLLCGFFAYSGVLNTGLAFMIILLGDFIPDTFFYFLGYYGRESNFVKKRFLNNKIFNNHLKTITKLWSEHSRKTMLLGKLSYGFAVPFLVSAGAVKMPYRKFISYAMVVSIFHYGIILFVGYLLGNSYASANYYMNFLHYGLAVIAIILFTVYFFIIKYARRKVIDLVEEEKREIENQI